MALTKEKKSDLIADYEKGFAVAPHAFLLDYKGITVPQVTALRDKVRDSGGHYAVVKNTLALRAIDGKALAELKEHFVGPTAVVYSMSDPVALAKALTDFAKDVPAVQVKAGLVESRSIAANQVKDIASLPSREQLIAKLLFLLQSPIARLARVLAAVPQQLVVVLDQVRKQKEEGGGAAPAGGGEAAS
jgi:large subunit ribosomal protein L10